MRGVKWRNAADDGNGTVKDNDEKLRLSALYVHGIYSCVGTEYLFNLDLGNVF